MAPHTVTTQSMKKKLRATDEEGLQHEDLNLVFRRHKFGPKAHF